MRHQSAFTLIELLVVVAIIGVLSAIAVPAYSNYVLRGQLTEAIATLSDIRVKMEQYFNDNRFYKSGSIQACSGPVPPGIVDTPSARFTFACSDLATNTYTLTATGKDVGGIKDFIYSIDQNNQRRTRKLPDSWNQTNVGPDSTCWVLKSDGSC